jgi:predicted TIM-barrel fold metal-dependent hydrolase
VSGQLLLEEVLVRHPTLRLFVENAGYPYRDEMIAMMTQYPQLHGEMVMFGSDQMRWPEKIGEAIDAIEQAPFLTEEQKRDILYHNAVRFLRLVQDASSARPSKEQ